MATFPVPNGRFIVRRADVCGGSPTIAGTRIRVSDIIRYRNLWSEAPVKRICEALPHLTSSQVMAAFRYNNLYRAEIEEEIRAEDELATNHRWPHGST
jgi:uncharacterized protein (DUF433 family)